MRILLVEDDPLIVDGLTRALRQRGHVVDVLGRGGEVPEALREPVHDLLLLDLGLPDIDGLQVLAELRKRHPALPVLVLTARDAIESRVAGLDAGADDYLTKPFAIDELDARIRALARRGSRALKGQARLGSLQLDLEQRLARLGAQPLSLTPREYGILEVLVLAEGRVVSKPVMRDALCAWDDDLSSAALDVHVHRLRRKIECGSVEIRTVRGFGYLLREVAGPAGEELPGAPS
ncbi:MAG: response regulator [Gammaproteobacteria bacterium]|nr:response regulator [Gammaproteobacteria bacterium]